MKRIILFLTLSICLNNYSQEVIFNGKVLDSFTEQPIPFCNFVMLNKRIGTSSGVNGDFELVLAKGINDSIKISSLGYYQKTISLKEINYDLNNEIFLHRKNTELEEVIINTISKTFNKKVRLGNTKEENITFTSSFGDEISVLIKNPYKITGKLKSIKLFLKKTKKADYVANLNIKFYKYDINNNIPGEEIYQKNLIIAPKNKTKKFNIEILDKNIIFPKDGICIGIEWLNNKNIKTKKVYKLGPSIAYTRDSNKEYTWGNYRGKGWYMRTFKRGNIINNALMQIEVLLPEESEHE